MHQWDFKSSITNMDDTHRFISEYVEPVTEGRKVANLLSVIQGPIMSNINFEVVDNPTTVVSFTLATDYLAHVIESQNR